MPRPRKFKIGDIVYLELFDKYPAYYIIKKYLMKSRFGQVVQVESERGKTDYFYEHSLEKVTQIESDRFWLRRFAYA